MTSIRKLKKKLKKSFSNIPKTGKQYIDEIVRIFRFPRKLRLTKTNFNEHKEIRRKMNFHIKYFLIN